VNKTRSFNKLGGIHDTGYSFAAFAPATQTLQPQPCARGSEVFVISGGRLCPQALEKSKSSSGALPAGLVGNGFACNRPVSHAGALRESAQARSHDPAAQPNRYDANISRPRSSQ
jgi:hypothetical protein